MRLYTSRLWRFGARRQFTNAPAPITKSVKVGASQLRLECGKLARFADGAALVHLGETSALVTAVASDTPTTSDFHPFVVDYRQKAASTGRVPANVLRRELGANDNEILTSRLIDRPLRPLFPSWFRYDTQVMCDVMCLGDHDPDVLCINGASLALSVSSIPWSGPVGAVRVVLDDRDRMHINPGIHAVPLNTRKLSLIVAGTTSTRIMMLHMNADQVSVDELNLCVQSGLEEIPKIVALITDMQTAIGKPKRAQPTTVRTVPPEVSSFVSNYSQSRMLAILSDHSHDKISRDQALRSIMKDLKEQPETVAFLESLNNDAFKTVESLTQVFFDLVRTTYRDHVLAGNLRCDGRAVDQSRPISCEVGLYPPLAGSSLFQRGQTQVQCTVTFDSPAAAFRNNLGSVLLGAPKEKKFMLHYEFPPYATNEVKTQNRANRRELGHGDLAERSVMPVVPDLGHTTRLTCEVLESNGSSSMASVCASSLALMDAGVPVRNAVCGVAMGLFTSEAGDRHKVLTDLMGFEDYVGDMDMKIAGTSNGFTALQMDLKIPGLDVNVFSEAISQAKLAHRHILNRMNECLSKERPEMKNGGPIVKTLQIPVHKRSQLMGPSASNLKRIQSDTGVELQLQADGSFSVFAPNESCWQQADAIIQEIISHNKEPVLESGSIYMARIVEILGHGVRVQLFPDQPPVLIPNSQLDVRRVAHASALGFKEGQDIRVKYYGRDPVSGQVRLSRKLLTMTTGKQMNLFERKLPFEKKVPAKS